MYSLFYLNILLSPIILGYLVLYVSGCNYYTVVHPSPHLYTGTRVKLGPEKQSHPGIPCQVRHRLIRQFLRCEHVKSMD